MVKTFKLTLFALFFFCLGRQAEASAIDPTAVLADMQINYKAKQWPRFFGIALYYRVTQKITDPSYQDHMLALELLALARHCQWKTVLDLENQYSSHNEFVKTKKALALIHMKKEFRNFHADHKKESAGVLNAIRESRGQWAIERDALKNLGSPERLQVQVESQCPS